MDEDDAEEGEAGGFVAVAGAEGGAGAVTVELTEEENAAVSNVRRILADGAILGRRWLGLVGKIGRKFNGQNANALQKLNLAPTAPPLKGIARPNTSAIRGLSGCSLRRMLA